MAFSIYNTGYLKRDNNHIIYYEQGGNPGGKPLVIVHGGPGGQINRKWGEFFDAAKWNIIFFDQRGCGQSTPFGTIQHNTTSDLVGDIEALRQHLQIDKWTLFGGSWGTTLSMAYGLAYPQYCEAFLLRGVWLARQSDIDWFLWGSKQLYPEYHAPLCDIIYRGTGKKPTNAQQIIAGAAQILFNDANPQQLALAKAWYGYEMMLSEIKPVYSGEPSDWKKAISIAKLECYYLHHELPYPQDLLTQVNNSSIKEINCEIVHGRYDMVCPVDEAFELHGVWTNSSLTIAEGAGHYTFEPEMAKQLHAAAKRLEK